MINYVPDKEYMITKKFNELFFKDEYELQEITQNQAYDLGLNTQVYIKKNGVAYPAKIIKCFENAQKFGIETM